ncbi:TPA: hypothetical protein P0P67_002654 [Staphylococcus aureus]|nr:hypothetical protein [Staphylococcus aureus]
MKVGVTMYQDVIEMFKGNDMTTTENIEEAIFILPKGQLISANLIVVLEV